MHLRVCIAAVAAVLLLLLGPAAAQADHTLSVSKSEAAAGDEVEFQISGTQAGESYIVKVEDREVASGVDSAGNGVTDKFKMPDFGNSNQSVDVEVRITPSNGDPDHLGVLPEPMQYVSAFSGATPEQPASQPQPAVTVPAPEVVPRTETPRTPRPSRRRTPEREPTGGKGNGNNKNNNGNTNGSPTSNNTPPSEPSSTPSSTSTGSSPSDTTSSNPSSSGGTTPTVPPGPTGPNAPVGSSIASTLSPLSGLAEPGKTGFPVLLILLIVLVAATVLTATGPRLWRRWEPALPWGPGVDDEVRLGALGRASASGAELQQTIAARRATRSTGRTL